MMKTVFHRCRAVSVLLALAVSLVLAGCAAGGSASLIPPPEQTAAQKNTSARFLVTVEDEPDTVDFQCTTLHYTVAQNVFDRLVEVEAECSGSMQILPSLAESWEISDDRQVYTFHLRENVTFSNGSPLTSSDVLYTLIRALTHPDGCNRSCAELILGASRLESGQTDRLEGFTVLSDLDFTITLEQPFEAFLTCLSMPGASILDEETTAAAGNRFGVDPAWTIGTGSFVLESWEPGVGMVLTANSSCWRGAPCCDGVRLLFVTDPEAVRMMFENGELDILNLDDLDNAGEFFIHGDIYQDRLHQVQQVGISYIALNESVPPLGDVRVRKALQLALNRTVLLDAVYSGRGNLENGIFPYWLYGYNPELAEIPYDPDEAKALLEQAGYPDGFRLTVSLSASSTRSESALVRLAASMWEKIGVDASIEVLDDNVFMTLRKRGKLSCYTATWTADYNDPENFIGTFFGSRENTTFRSLCYPDEAVMKRVRDARVIDDAVARLREYRELERIIVQEDAAWIPLFSRVRYYVVSDRVKGFRASWNGSVKSNYREFSIEGDSP